MKHFDSSQWSDFVRNLTDGENKESMIGHLDHGCKKCRQTVDLWHHLVQCATNETQYQVPEHVVRLAKSIFVLNHPEKVQRIPRIYARLIFDSSRSPVLAGVRSGQVFSRQALYQARNFSLDLRLDQEPRSSRVMLVGQIADSKEPTRQLSEVAVFLMRGKQIVAQAVSNRFGEFQMEYQARNDLRLRVLIGGLTRQIEVPLKQFMQPNLPENRLSNAVLSKRKK